MKTQSDRCAAANEERFAFLLDGVRPGMTQARVYRIMVKNLRKWQARQTLAEGMVP